jgi:MoaA/NifB/PqqE/SkfB family radical SAM enzyme
MITSVEGAVSYNNKLSFLIDWEITLKCNLDCGYCDKGIYGGHENSIPHPNLEKCLKTLDFLYEYVDIYMQAKKNLQSAVLNVYGGESLYHPDIVTILKQSKEKHQKYNWNLTITTTTNLILSQKILNQILNYIDEFTCSFHSENTDKQLEIFKENLLFLKSNNKNFKVVILMNPKKWEYCLDMISFCQENNMRFLIRQLDQPLAKAPDNYNSELKKKETWYYNVYLDRPENHEPKYTYSQEQISWFEEEYNGRNKNTVTSIDKNNNLNEQGRCCCGGRLLSTNQNYKNKVSFVNNNFFDWYCSVNYFFVFVKQVTEEIFVNKDCMMNFSGNIGPIGNLKNYNELLNFTKTNLENKTLPVIKCAKQLCRCGLCAPKAKDKEIYLKIMNKYIN